MSTKKPTSEPSGNRIIVYKGKKGWRWRALTQNGRNVANSGEDYGDDRGKAVKAAKQYGPLYPVYVLHRNGEYENK